MKHDTKAAHRATTILSHESPELWIQVKIKAEELQLSVAKILVLLLRAWVSGDIQIEVVNTIRVYAGRTP